MFSFVFQLIPHNNGLNTLRVFSRASSSLFIPQKLGVLSLYILNQRHAAVPNDFIKNYDHLLFVPALQI